MWPGYHAHPGTNKLLWVVALLLTLVAAPLGARASEVSDEVGLCARCHEGPAALEVNDGGHSSLLDCQSCHRQRKPRRFGRRHRRVPRCTSCHEDVPGHPPKQRNRRKTNKNCKRCHAPHGSPNLALVGTGIRQRHRIAPMSFVSEAGAAPGGFTDPDDPGTGLCEVCHRTTDFYRRNGTGEPHFTDSCTLCHMHDVAFQPVADAQNCRICHTQQAALFEIPSPHSARFDCVNCHTDTALPIGPGHQTIADCQDCHERPPSHAPNGDALPCGSCHNPHGSTNLDLIGEEIETPAGTRPIVFTNLMGRADGSFASTSDPGSGLCEVCHTTTRFYRADGNGAPHFTDSCTLCHTHDSRFDPVANEGNCRICHVEQAERFEIPSAHSERFDCVNCHMNTSLPIGPGHETIPDCADCHDQQTHAPNGQPFACARCHNPHGTTNMYLVSEAIETPQGTIRPILFTNLMGQADGSFASASDPGSGICEVCHTTTPFYNASGTGAGGHYTFSCLPCHRHSQGFDPR